jgi:Fe-coproporphyrin III synthase
MILQQSLYHTYKRYRTLSSDTITALPIVILMPHSACNCRCVMCDIWKDNKNLKQLSEKDISDLLSSLKKLETKQVLMSGGEAMLNPNFFILCQILKALNIKITVLSTGLTLKKNAEQLIELVDDVIVSLDGNEEIHDRIRNIPNAFSKLKEGVRCIKSLNPSFRISARTVIHQLNFRVWPRIIDAAKEIGVDQISFLPADVSSHAFNREVLWSSEKQSEVLVRKEELEELTGIVDSIIVQYDADFKERFIAESPNKIRNIVAYYKAIHGVNDFPFKKCNAPWVSAVIEADGSVRPCFFHEAYGNIHEQQLSSIVNNKKATAFRQELNIELNETCKRCVCYLNLPPRVNPAIV